MKQFLFTILTIFSFTLSAQNNSQQLLTDFLNNGSVKNAAVSICVVDANTDSILLAMTPQLCIVPASVQKLVTSATALEILQGNRKFVTYVWAVQVYVPVSGCKINAGLIEQILDLEFPQVLALIGTTTL